MIYKYNYTCKDKLGKRIPLHKLELFNVKNIVLEDDKLIVNDSEYIITVDIYMMSKLTKDIIKLFTDDENYKYIIEDEKRKLLLEFKNIYNMLDKLIDINMNIPRLPPSLMKYIGQNMYELMKKRKLPPYVVSNMEQHIEELHKLQAKIQIDLNLLYGTIDLSQYKEQI